MSLVSHLRESILPLKPTDSASTRILKQSGFYLFMVMVVLISAAIGIAILFVL